MAYDLVMITDTCHPITEYIRNANGCENWYFDRLFKGIEYSAGVKVCRDNGCNWLIVAILSHLHKFVREDFVVASFKKHEDGSGVLLFTDGNSKVLGRQKFDYVDAPSNLTFYVENAHLMFPEER